MEGHVVILLYCTGRGQHDRVDLYKLTVQTGSGPAGVQGIWLEPLAAELTPEKGGRLGMRMHLPCIVCTREPVWTPQRTRMIHAAALAADTPQLDLSYLD